jgi:hypothetical protein
MPASVTNGRGLWSSSPQPAAARPDARIGVIDFDAVVVVPRARKSVHERDARDGPAPRQAAGATPSSAVPNRACCASLAARSAAESVPTTFAASRVESQRNKLLSRESRGKRLDVRTWLCSNATIAGTRPSSQLRDDDHRPHAGESNAAAPACPA